MSDDAKTSLPLTARLLVHAIWLGGIVLTPGLGVVGREVLIARDVPVVTLTEGARLILPMAIWADIPFLLLAFVVRRRLRSAAKASLDELPKAMVLSAGAFLGALAAMGISLFGAVTYSGPGGFAEVVIMLLVMWPMTTAAMVFYCAAGAAIGALLAAIVWRIASGPPD